MTVTQSSFYLQEQLLSVRAASTSNISGVYLNGPSNNGVAATLTTTANTLTVDTVLLKQSDRVVLAGQTDASQNGIYFVASAPTAPFVILQRTTDFQSNIQMRKGQYFTVEEGSTYDGDLFIFVTTGSIVIGQTALVFNNISSSIGGIVPINEGGTGADLSVNSAGGVLYSAGTTFQVSQAPTAVGQVLQGSNTDQPEWSTATYPVTTTINRILYSSANNVVSELKTANSASLVTSNAGVPTWSAAMTDGEIIIGSTGATPTPATLTAGSGISITNGGGSITIAAPGFLTVPSWSVYLTTSTTADKTGDGTNYDIVYDTIDINNGSIFDGTSTVTIPTTGNYQVSFTVTTYGYLNTHVRSFAYLNVNGDTKIYQFNQNSGFATSNSASIMTVSGTMIIHFTAGDTIKTEINVGGGTKVIGVYGFTDNQTTRFSGLFIQ